MNIKYWKLKKNTIQIDQQTMKLKMRNRNKNLRKKKKK